MDKSPFSIDNPGLNVYDVKVIIYTKEKER